MREIARNLAENAEMPHFEFPAWKMVRAAGFEPADENPQSVEDQSLTDEVLDGYTQIRAQISDADRQTLARVVESWPRLSGGLKLAIQAIIESERGEGGGK